jgi:hypothetical protein
MKKRVLTIAITLTLIFTTLSAQHGLSGEGENEFKHSLGLGAGATTGLGLAYRYMPADFGVMVMFAPVADSYQTMISFGLTFFQRLAATEKVNFFLYQGNHLLHENYNKNYPQYNTKSTSLNNGVGIGLELIIYERVGWNIMGGYASYDTFSRIGFTGETALFFRF